MSITGLTAGFPVIVQAITKHLRVMEQAGSGAQHTARAGERVQMDRQRLQDARRYLDVISRQWDDALDRLRKFVED